MFQALDEQTAYLKDQLQELKARTGLETGYIKKQTQVSLSTALSVTISHCDVAQSQVQCSQRRNQLSEENLTDERDKLEQQLDEEKRAHDNIVTYLKEHTEVTIMPYSSSRSVIGYRIWRVKWSIGWLNMKMNLTQRLKKCKI